MRGIWQFYGTQVDGSGFVKELPNATVTVRRESDGNLASLESDIDGSSPGLDNPFTAGSDGEITFYADSTERYRIDIESGALSLTLRHQAVSISTRALRNPAAPENLGLSCSVAANALTIAAKAANGDNASASNPASIPFCSSSAGSGVVNWRDVDAALTLTVPNGATLGHNSALKQYIYVYALDYDNAAELAVSFKFFGWHGIVSTTAMSTGSDTGTVMYSTSARTSVPFTCIALLEVTESTAGAWGTEPSMVHYAPFTHPLISFSAHKNGSDQTGIATNTATKLTFATEQFDNGGLFDAATNHRFQPPPGTVTLHASAAIIGPADQTIVQLLMYKNGSTHKQAWVYTSGTSSQMVNISFVDECNGTDYYEVWVLHTHGSNRDVQGTTDRTYFMGSWSPSRS